MPLTEATLNDIAPARLGLFTVLRPPIEAPRGITAHACGASPEPAALERLALDAGAGLIRPAVTRVVALEEIGKA